MPATLFAVRPARAEDEPAIRALVDAAYGGYVARMGVLPGPMRDDHASLIEAGYVHVVDGAQGIIGVVVLIDQPSSLMLHNVAVQPGHKGSGLGRFLLEYVESEARQRNFDAIELYTHVSMVENIALYSRIGYVESHRRIDGNLARVYMRKTLPGAPQA